MNRCLTACWNSTTTFATNNTWCATEVSDLGKIAADCLSGMVECSAPSGCARPLYRLECGSTPKQCSLRRIQLAILASALGEGEKSGVAHSGPHRPAHLPGLAEPLRPPAVLSGNLRGSRAIPRHLLLRCQLDPFGRDHRPGQSFQQLRPQPLDQAHSGISIASTLSRTAR